MKLLAQLLTLYTWGAVCVLLFFLFGIAQFFEQRLSEKNSTRKRRRHYPLFLVPMGLYAISAVIYTFDTPFVVGNVVADGLRLVGALIFAYATYSLFKTMVGGRS